MLVEDLEQYNDNDDDFDDDDDEDDEDDDDEVLMKDGVRYREVDIREQDRFLPVANIARIMKKVLPNNAKMAKDSKESIQTCVSEFISFITSEASEKCQQEKRKTINGDDIMWAMATLGFDSYIEPLRVYLGKYRDTVKGDRPERVERKPHERIKKEKKPDTERASRSDSAPSSSSAATTSSSSPLVPSMMHIIDPQTLNMPIMVMPYMYGSGAHQLSPMGGMGQDNMQLPSVRTLAAAASVASYRPLEGASGLLSMGDSAGESGLLQKRPLLPLPPLATRLGTSSQFGLSHGLMSPLSPILPSPEQLGMPSQSGSLLSELNHYQAPVESVLGIAAMASSKMKKRRTEI